MIVGLFIIVALAFIALPASYLYLHLTRRRRQAALSEEPNRPLTTAPGRPEQPEVPEVRRRAA